MRTQSSQGTDGHYGLYVLAQTLYGDAAIAAFRDAALALADDQIEVLSVEPSVMVSNVRAGVAAVLPRLSSVVEARPRTHTGWIVDLVNLARAVEHAAASCATAPPVPRAMLDAKYAELQRYRVPALQAAQALSSELVGALPAVEVAAIVAGSGLYNHAQDGVSLASLFRRNADAIGGKHPFSEPQLAAMEAAGVWIMENVTPDGARARKHPPAEMSSLRDRLWSMLKVRHAELRKAGIELFGEDGVDAEVPRLGVRARVTPAKDPERKPSVTPLSAVVD